MKTVSGNRSNALVTAKVLCVLAPLCCQTLATFGADDPSNRPPRTPLNVRDFGAVGDGRTLDSPALNQAIQAAARAGGGTVFVPAGT
jgi:hypothetical protein